MIIYTDGGIPGTYGAFVWIRSNDTFANEAAKGKSMWGGHTKTWNINGDKHYGYEISEEQWEQVIEDLKDYEIIKLSADLDISPA